MTDGDRGDPIAEYVEVLRGFGLDDAEVVSLHGIDPGVEDPAPVDHLRVHFDGQAPGPEDLHDRLREVLADSSRGIDADREYWDGVVEDQVGAVLDPYGYAVGVDANAPGADLRITVEDRVTGETREREFVYPTGHVGDDDYPAVLAAVEDLVRDELAFVHLRSDRWRFVLVEADDLASLQAEYGDRIGVFGRPLLADRQSPADADATPEGAATDGSPGDERDGSPDGATATDGPDVDDRGTSDPTDWPTPDAPGSTGADPDSRSAVPGGGDGDGDDSARDDGTPPSPPGSGPAWLRRAVASEGGIDEVVETLSEGGPRTHVSDRTPDDVLAELSTPDADRVEGTTTTGPGIDEVFDQMGSGDDSTGGPPDEVVSERGIDEVFEEIESAADPPEEVHAGGGPGPTEVRKSGAATTTIEADDLLERSETGGFESIAGGGPESVVSERGLDDVFGESEDPEGVVTTDADPGDTIAGVADADAETGDESTATGDVETGVEELFDSLGSADPDAVAEGDPDAMAGDDPDAMAGDDPDAMAGDDPDAMTGDDPDAVAEANPDAVAGGDPDPAGSRDAGPAEESPATGSPPGERAADRDVGVEDVIELAEDDDFDSLFAGSGEESADAADTELDEVTADTGFDDLADDGRSDPDEVLEDDDSIQDLIVEVGDDRAASDDPPDRPQSFDPSVPIRDAESPGGPEESADPRGEADAPGEQETADEPGDSAVVEDEPGSGADPAVDPSGEATAGDPDPEPAGDSDPEPVRDPEPETAGVPGEASASGDPEPANGDDSRGSTAGGPEAGTEIESTDVPGEGEEEPVADREEEPVADREKETIDEKDREEETIEKDREGTPVDTVDWIEAAERSSSDAGASQSGAEARASGTDGGNAKSDESDRVTGIVGRIRSLADRLFGR